MRRFANVWLPTAFAFAAVAAGATAQVHPHPVIPPGAPVAHPSVVTVPVTPIPVPRTTFKPPKSLLVHAVPSGTKVPLSRLPRLPMKTALNTIMPGHHGRGGGRFRPFAATGATLTITAAAACATGGTTGALFNVNCQLTIQGSNISLWSNADTYQYYVVPPNSVTATEFGGAGQGCNPVTDPWTSASIPACTGTDTLLSQQGTYSFFVYDTVQQVVAAVVYVNAGQVFNIGVYQDPFHTQSSAQFDIATSPAAYIYLTNVAPSDHYVTYVMSTGVNAYCVYLTPSANPTPLPPSPRPTGGVLNPQPLLCNPNNSPGVQAPGGDLSVTWSFDQNLEGGAYQIVVWDKDANNGAGEALGSVQVSLLQSTGDALLTKGSTTGMNPSPGPNGPTSTTVLAWNSSTDQSVGGITALTQQNVLANTYTWTMSDPQGQVLANASEALGANGQASNTFNMPAGAFPPGEYPSPNWILQFYNPTAKQVYGSQAFQIVGYHSKTRFVIGGKESVQLNFDQSGPPEVVTADLKIYNDGDSVFGGASNADSFGQGNTVPAIEFTTGRYDSLTAAFRPPGAAPNGVAFGGVTVALSAGAAGENCKSAAGCTEVETDSNGNQWTVADYCSVAPASSLGLHDQCVVTLTPVNASTVLPPGAFIDIPNMVWYGTNTNANWPCFSTPCFATTTELPSHGLSWSFINNLANPTGWTPVSFGGQNGGGLVLAGTAQFDFSGSQNSGGTGRNNNAAQGTTPWVGGHFYQAAFTRADYQNSTPFSPANSRFDVASITIVNNSQKGSNGAADATITNGGAGYPELAIGFPTVYTPSQIVVDSASTANWTKIACPSSFGSQYVCFNGPTIAGAGGTAQLFVDVPLSIPSFATQELTVQAFSGDFAYFTLTPGGANESTIDTQSSFDGLGIAGWSLNSALMSASFNPPTVGSGQAPTAFQVVIENTTTGADPNPDSIDALVLEERGGSPAANYAVSGGPTVTTTQGGWSYLGTVNSANPANTRDYWFGVCPAATSGWVSLAGGPPQPNGIAVPLNYASGSSYTKMATCAADNKSLLSDATHSTATINMSLTGPFAAGTQTFYLYAHGANGGGWSSPKTFQVTFSNEAAQSGFSKIGATCASLTAIATNAQPSIGGSPNCYVYELKNVSGGVTPVNKFFITIPAFDINGLPATDTGGNHWQLTAPFASTITLSGNGSAGCTVNTTGGTFNPNPGVSNGQIEIDGCSVAPGKVVDVQFQASSPGVQNDTYDFPAALETAGGTPAGQTWIGDQSVQVQFSIGLAVTVNPTNPGSGGSTPVVSCTQCAFSGTTIDYGSIGNKSNVVGTDVAKASVIYTGTTSSNTWTLSASTSGNPTCAGATCAGGAPLSELLMQVDKPNSNSKCAAASVVYQNFSSFVPVTAGGVTLVSSGPETSCATPYEIINSYEVQVGTEAVNGYVQTITYTLVAN